MHAFIQSQRDDQSFGDMRWGKWSMDSYTSRPVARWAKNRLNSAAAPHIEFKESLEEILSFMVFAQIQTCISFHEVGHACACGRSRVHVSTHRAVSVAPLAESYLVLAVESAACAMKISCFEITDVLCILELSTICKHMQPSEVCKEFLGQ